MVLDMLHIVVGIAVTAMAAVSFVNPEEYLFFFPIIFFLAAVLNLATGKYRMLHSKRDSKKKAAALVQMFFGGALVVLAAVSAISIWWG